MPKVRGKLESDRWLVDALFLPPSQSEKVHHDKFGCEGKKNE